MAFVSVNFFLARSCRTYVYRELVSTPMVSSANAADSALTAEPTGELSLARAIDATLRRNPAPIVTSYELKAANARITQAGLTVEAAADYHRLVAEIERLTGEPLAHDHLEAPLP